MPVVQGLEIATELVEELQLVGRRVELANRTDVDTELLKVIADLFVRRAVRCASSCRFGHNPEAFLGRPWDEGFVDVLRYVSRRFGSSGIAEDVASARTGSRRGMNGGSVPSLWSRKGAAPDRAGAVGRGLRVHPRAPNAEEGGTTHEDCINRGLTPTASVERLTACGEGRYFLAFLPFFDFLPSAAFFSACEAFRRSRPSFLTSSTAPALTALMIFFASGSERLGHQ